MTDAQYLVRLLSKLRDALIDQKEQFPIESPDRLKMVCMFETLRNALSKANKKDVISAKDRLNRLDSELEEQEELLDSAMRSGRSLAEIEEKLTEGQKEISAKMIELEKERMKETDSDERNLEHQEKMCELEGRIDELRKKNEMLSVLINEKAEVEKACADLQLQIDQKKQERAQITKEIKQEAAALQRLKTKSERMLSQLRSEDFRLRYKISRLQSENVLKEATIGRRDAELKRVVNRLEEIERKREQEITKKLIEFNNADLSSHGEKLRNAMDEELELLIKHTQVKKELMIRQFRRQGLTNDFNTKKSKGNVLAELQQINHEISILNQDKVPLGDINRRIENFLLRNIKSNMDGKILVKHGFNKVQELNHSDKCGFDSMPSKLTSLNEHLERVNREKEILQSNLDALLTRCGSIVCDFANKNPSETKKVIGEMIEERLNDLTRCFVLRSLLEKLNIQPMREPSIDSKFTSTLFVYHRPSLETSQLSVTSETEERIGNDILACHTPVGYYSRKRPRMFTKSDTDGSNSPTQ